MPKMKSEKNQNFQGTQLTLRCMSFTCAEDIGAQAQPPATTLMDERERHWDPWDPVASATMLVPTFCGRNCWLIQLPSPLMLRNCDRTENIKLQRRHGEIFFPLRRALSSLTGNLPWNQNNRPVVLTSPLLAVNSSQLQTPLMVFFLPATSIIDNHHCLCFQCRPISLPLPACSGSLISFPVSCNKWGGPSSSPPPWGLCEPAGSLGT